MCGKKRRPGYHGSWYAMTKEGLRLKQPFAIGRAIPALPETPFAIGTAAFANVAVRGFVIHGELR
jgi:hypothetical protein